MEKLSTIQKQNNLNEIFRADELGVGNACHAYLIRRASSSSWLLGIQFQHGARNEAGSTDGVLDCDLLEIVRDRLKAFQTGDYATRENACALTHIEEALMWMNKRVEDRAERGVLGTEKV